MKAKINNERLRVLFPGDKYYRDQYKNEYALVAMEGYKAPLKISSGEYWDYVEYSLLEAGESIGIKTIINMARLTAKYEGRIKPLHLRVAKHDDNFYHDLSCSGYPVIRINDKGWMHGHTDKVLFERLPTQSPQVLPNKNGDINLIYKYLNSVPSKYKLLLVVHIILSFVPDIAHAPIILQSEKGSGKSTLAKIMKRIIDPGITDALDLSGDERNLLLALSNHYFVNFDNVHNVPTKVSDAFCRAVTGSGNEQRRLHTNSDVVIRLIKACISFNGISLGILRDDLLDRSILLKLQKPSKGKKIPDSTLWDSFNADLPDILGGIFTALSKAMALYSKDCPKSSFRIIDYSDWGYAVAEALGGKGDEYLQALDQNRIDKKDELIQSNALCQAIKQLMKEKDHWDGQTNKLLTELDLIATKLRLGRGSKQWPGNAISLGHQLAKVISLLAEDGIIIKNKHTNRGSTISISKK